MKENADKTRGLDAAELAKQLRDGSEQMFRLRFQLSMGQADGLTKLRKLRRERARMLTIQRERELGQSVTPVAKVPAAKAPAKKPAVKRAAPKAAAAKKPAVKKGKG
jgi:large subunit ribosomal protein L29